MFPTWVVTNAGIQLAPPLSCSISVFRRWLRCESCILNYRQFVKCHVQPFLLSPHVTTTDFERERTFVFYFCCSVTSFCSILFTGLYRIECCSVISLNQYIVLAATTYLPACQPASSTLLSFRDYFKTNQIDPRFLFPLKRFLDTTVTTVPAPAGSVLGRRKQFTQAMKQYRFNTSTRIRIIA